MQINHHLVVGNITYRLNSPIGLDLRRPLEIGFFGARALWTWRHKSPKCNFVIPNDLLDENPNATS